jgi:hypothetical protein
MIRLIVQQTVEHSRAGRAFFSSQKLLFESSDVPPSDEL